MALQRTAWNQRSVWAGFRKPRRPTKPIQIRKAPAAAKAPALRSATLTPQAVAPPPSRNPGPSSTGAAGRAQAQQQFGLSVADINRQLLQAALRYGGSPNVGLYNTNDTMYTSPVATNDPNSSLAAIGRTFNENTRNLNDELSRNNTFASGMHLTRQQEIADLKSRDESQALRDYEDAVAQLQGLYGQSRAGYGSDMAAANQADIDYAASQAPIPGVQAAVPKSTSSGNPKYPFVQTSGSRTGKAYRIILKNGKRYRQYQGEALLIPA